MLKGWVRGSTANQIFIGSADRHAMAEVPSNPTGLLAPPVHAGIIGK